MWFTVLLNLSVKFVHQKKKEGYRDRGIPRERIIARTGYNHEAKNRPVISHMFSIRSNPK